MTLAATNYKLYDKAGRFYNKNFIGNATKPTKGNLNPIFQWPLKFKTFNNTAK